MHRQPRRRSALTSAVAVLLAGASGSAVVGAMHASASGDDNNGRIKNVIYLLGDGMGRTHVPAARDRYYGANGHLVMETLPAVGQVSTYSIAENSGQPGSADF